MLHKVLLLITLSLITFTPVMAGDSGRQSGFMEENDLYIGVEDKAASTITQIKFNAVLDRLQKIYGPIFQARGKQLKIYRLWENGKVNAFARQIANQWQIHMFGGMARHPLVTSDAFALVACHEIGHHVGGVPKKMVWASSEGQADYFANSKCFRKFAEQDDNVAIVKTLQVPTIVSEKCQANFTLEEDIAICVRGSMGGLTLGILLNTLKKGKVPIKFETPDPVVVGVHYNGHPVAQCRVDTYLQGSICDKSADEDFSDSDLNPGACTRSAGYTDGIRPLCWFKPSQSL